ncbi:MAG: tetratricopeptide repeat protein [Myxococcales bacterium]|nr:tetratricopeptide repeat protein [Myxococcales bacterium]
MRGSGAQWSAEFEATGSHVRRLIEDCLDDLASDEHGFSAARRNASFWDIVERTVLARAKQEFRSTLGALEHDAVAQGHDIELMATLYRQQTLGDLANRIQTRTSELALRDRLSTEANESAEARPSGRNGTDGGAVSGPRTEPHRIHDHIKPSSSATVLFLAANPMESARLAIDREQRDIEKKLHAARYRDSINLKSKWATQADDLQDALLREEPTIVHFSGHGAGAPGIVLHGADGESEQLVSGEALQHLFRSLKGRTRIVILNACYSRVQAEAIVREVDFVIGMEASIDDESARVFSAAFYRGLAFGKSVETAFELGVNAIRLPGLPDDEAPVLLVASGASPDDVLIRGAPAEDPLSERPALIDPKPGDRADKAPSSAGMSSGKRSRRSLLWLLVGVGALGIPLVSFTGILQVTGGISNSDDREMQVIVSRLLDEAWDLLGAAPGSVYVADTFSPSDRSRIELARRRASEALTLAPNDDRAKLILAMCDVAIGRTEAAVGELEALLSADSSNDAVWNGLGIARYNLERYSEAERAYRRSIELNPRRAATHMNLGNALWKLGRSDSAIAEYQRAAELDPQYASPHVALGVTYGTNGDYAAALSEYALAAQIDPLDSELWDKFPCILGCLTKMDVKTRTHLLDLLEAARRAAVEACSRDLGTRACEEEFPPLGDLEDGLLSLTRSDVGSTCCPVNPSP